MIGFIHGNLLRGHSRIRINDQGYVFAWAPNRFTKRESERETTVILRILFCLLLFATVVGAQTARNFRRATFENLGSPASGNESRSCPNCTVGDPCTGGGTGAYAYAAPTGDRWVCTSQAPGGGGGGSVTSVALSVPNIFSVSGSPVTSTGTFSVTLASQSANRFFGGPATGAAAQPTFRPLVAADLGTGTADSTKFLRGDLTWQTALGSVTSVAASVPVEFSLSGSPITGAGTLAITKAAQTANTIWAGPTTGSAAQPGFRTLVAADIPSIAEVKFLFSDITTANADTTKHGLVPKLSGSGSDCFRGDGSWLGCGGGSGGGDFSTNTTTSALNQVVVASGSGGKTGQFATGSGIGIFTAGVLSFKTNPSGAFVGDTDSQTLTNKTLTTPTIASFANANHNHTNSAGGGTLALNAFGSSTGSGAVVGQTAPTLTTPNIGVATATSVNKVAITAPATSATLTIANLKTATFNNSITFTGTDSTTQTFQASDTIVGRNTTDSLGNKTMLLPILGANAGLPVTCSAGQWVRNSSESDKAFYCYATNTWGEVLVAGSSGTVSAASGGSGLASGDAAGTITISGATSGTKTFSTTLSAAPKCVATPTSDIGAVRFWVTKSTTTLTINTSSSISASFDFHCILIP